MRLTQKSTRWYHMIMSRYPFATATKRSVCKTQINGFTKSTETVKIISELRTLNLSKLFLNFSIYCAKQLTSTFTVFNSDCSRHLNIDYFTIVKYIRIRTFLFIYNRYSYKIIFDA